MMKTLLFVCLSLFAIACSGGDGPSDLVGASCRDDFDCEENCLGGGDFPGGFCSISCRDDLDCPEETICANKDGGHCVYPCGGVRDCDFLGGSYTCRGADDWAGRDVLVCLGR